MRLLIVSTMRNEGPFILDWIAHHRAMGATDFLIFSNDCTDGTDVMLDSLASAGVVHVRQSIASGERPQWAALRQAWRHDLRKRCDWAAVLDVDEFICVHKGQGTFQDLMGGDAQAIAMPWRLFGNGGQVAFDDVPAPDQFKTCAAPDLNFPVSAQFFKTLFDLAGPFSGFGVHRPKQKKAGPVPAWRDGSGAVLQDAWAANPKVLNLTGRSPARDLVECHHYSLRSVQSFLVKADRGLPNHVDKPIDLAYWMRRNFNGSANTAIAKRAADTAAAKSELLAAPGVAAAHQACVAAHRSAIQAHLRDPAMLSLYSDILVAGNSVEISAQVAKHISDLYRAIL